MNPTQRFSSRVVDYVKYRPSYPQQVVDWLTAQGALSSASLVADIGSGTGLLTELFLRNGNRVCGVEPNMPMRQAGEQHLGSYPDFKSLEGTAEATGLADHSVDLVTAGQAFHWFDRERARREFARILRPPGWCVLVWNERLADTTAFLVAYEQLMQEYAIDYQAADHRQVTDAMIGEFFQPGGFRRQTFANRQTFDFAGLAGRLASSSYAPQPGHADYQPMLGELRAIFDTHQVNGQVAFEYATKVYLGQVSLG